MEAHQMKTAEQTVDAPPVARVHTVLIVDDHEMVTRALARLFTSAGYKPVTFVNALSALEYVKTDKPDAAIIDIHLPDLSGLVLSQRLRAALGQQTPIIILS